MDKILSINGKEFIATKIVQLDNNIYQEYCCADYLHPEVVYTEQSSGKVVNDWKTYYALREKYAIDKRLLHGKLVLKSLKDSLDETEWEKELRSFPCFKSIEIEYVGKPKNVNMRGGKVEEVNCRVCQVASGEHAGKELSFVCIDEKDQKQSLDGRALTEFFLLEMQKVLDKYFESDVKKFSEKAAAALGDILKKRGIESPQKWFEEKMKGKAEYMMDYYSNDSACCIPEVGIIFFPSNLAACSEFTRAHEMIHKVCMGDNRCGLSVIDVHEKIDYLVQKTHNKDFSTQKVHKIYSENGRALNEGMTNVMAEIVSEKRFDGKHRYSGVYLHETVIAKKIIELVGADVAFESMLFDPSILANRFTQMTGDKTTFVRLILWLDEYYRQNEKLAEHRKQEEIDEDTKKQYTFTDESGNECVAYRQMFEARSKEPTAEAQQIRKLRDHVLKLTLKLIDSLSVKKSQEMQSK